MVGLVMPYSALRTGQHLKWRSGRYKQKGGRNAPSISVNMKVREPWDLDNVVPDFFPMPASVVFAQYDGVRRSGNAAGAGNRAGVARRLTERLRWHPADEQSAPPRRRQVQVTLRRTIQPGTHHR